MPKTERKILDQLIQYRYWLFLLAATALPGWPGRAAWTIPARI